MNNLWGRLFWRTALRIMAAGFILGGLYAPIFYTLVLFPGLLFNHSAYENIGVLLWVYVLTVVIGAVFGCIFGVVLGIIEGIVQGIATVIILRFFFFPPRDEIQLKYSLIGSGLIVSLIVGYIYFARYLPGLSGINFVIPLIIAVIANVWIVQKIGIWYLNEVIPPSPDESQYIDLTDND